MSNLFVIFSDCANPAAVMWMPTEWTILKIAQKYLVNDIG